MPVKDLMSKDLVTVNVDNSVMKASKLMKERKIQHLPVIKKKGVWRGLFPTGT